MNKKTIRIVVALLVLLVVGVSLFFVFNNRQVTTLPGDFEVEKNTTDNGNVDENTTGNEDKKVLVVYYSATNHTSNVAIKIAQNLNADLFKIEPEEPYTSDDLNWSDENSRVSKEHDDESLRDVKLKTSTVNNWDDYDIVLIGYPIWWGEAARPVNNFVKENDFTGKVAIPFCTSSSSGLGDSGKSLEEMSETGNWQQGQRFSSNPTDDDIKTFTDSIK